MPISFGSSLIRIESAWTAFLAIVSAKNLPIQYLDDGTVYNIFALDGPIVYFCTIWKGTVPATVVSTYSQSQNDTDKSAFTTTYLTAANKPVAPQVNAEGKLQVITPAPSAPSGTTSVSYVDIGNVTSNQTAENTYTITSGKVLTIQRFTGGGENSVAGGRVELHVRANSGVTPSSATLIAVGYLSGGNFQFDIDESFTGDGSRQVMMRRINLGGSAMHITAKWQGYEV